MTTQPTDDNEAIAEKFEEIVLREAFDEAVESLDEMAQALDNVLGLGYSPMDTCRGLSQSLCNAVQDGTVEPGVITSLTAVSVYQYRKFMLLRAALEELVEISRKHGKRYKVMSVLPGPFAGADKLARVVEANADAIERLLAASDPDSM